MKKIIPGIVTDIDGVLICGSEAIKNVDISIKHLF